MQAIKYDYNIQARVDQHLQELAGISQAGTSAKLKFQRVGQVKVFVHNQVKWPQEFVLSGLTKEKMAYGQLKMSQWLAGFCHTMREETNQNLRNHMLNYLMDLLIISDGLRQRPVIQYCFVAWNWARSQVMIKLI